MLIGGLRSGRRLGCRRRLGRRLAVILRHAVRRHRRRIRAGRLGSSWLSRRRRSRVGGGLGRGLVHLLRLVSATASIAAAAAMVIVLVHWLSIVPVRRHSRRAALG